MTHIELLTLLVKKMPKLTREEGEILKNIVSKIAIKGDSLFEFYEELCTTNGILNLSTVKEISQKYSVPELYKDHIHSRFNEFRKNIRIVSSRNAILKQNGKPMALDPEKWTKNKLRMFASTEKMVIEKAGGLEEIGLHIHDIGYFDYLEKLFLESAIDISRIKYSSLLNGKKDLIEYSKDE